jgi:hypothetical protein
VSRRVLPAALLAAASALLAACAPLPAPRRFAGSLDVPLPTTSGRVAVIADLQRTSYLEFWRESNDPERAALVQALAAARPDAVFVIGDLVFDGGSARHWADLDALMAPVRDAGIPVFAAFGNHEYWGGRDERFQRGGKLFIVAGGGGGPRAALAQGAARCHPDDLARGAALRPFHFLLIAPAPEGLAVEVHGLPKGGREAATLDHFMIPWPARQGRER